MVTSRLQTALGELSKTYAYGSMSYTWGIRYKVSGYPMNEPVVDWIDVIIAPHEREAARAFWERALTSSEKSLMGDWEYTNGRWSELPFYTHRYMR